MPPEYQPPDYEVPTDEIAEASPSPAFASTSDRRVTNNVMRHNYRVLTDEEKHAMERIKDAGLQLYQLLDDLGESRELSIARQRVEESVMWGVKHLTR